MVRDRSKFSKIAEFNLYDFAKWVLEDHNKLRNKLKGFEDVWIVYQFQQEKKVITFKNYKYWVVWSDKNKQKSYLLYPCHTYVLEQRRSVDKSFEDAH